MSYGLLAEFADADALLAAAKEARAQGFRRVEAYAPFAVPGLADAVESPRNLIPRIALIGGIAGGAIGFGMQFYSAVIDYPINSGGRPLNSWPAFVSVTVETTILFAALAAFFGMLFLNGLPRLFHPLQEVKVFDLATRNRFFLCIRSDDPKFNEAGKFLRRLHTLSITDVAGL